MTLTQHAFLFCGLVLAPAAGIVAVRRMERGPFVAILFGFVLVAGIAELGWIGTAVACAHLFPSYPRGGPPEAIALLSVVPALAAAYGGIRAWQRLATRHEWIDAGSKAQATPGAEPYRRASRPRSSVTVGRPRRTRFTEATVAAIGGVWLASLGFGAMQDRRDDDAARTACAAIRVGDTVSAVRERATGAGVSVRSLERVGDGDQFLSFEGLQARARWFVRRASTSDTPLLWIEGATVDCEIDHRAGRVTSSRLTTDE